MTIIEQKMKKKEIFNSIIDYCYVIFFVIIIYVRNVLNINVPIVLTTILTIAYMMFGRNTIPVILAFLMTFRSAIQGNFILTIALFIYFIKGKKKIKKDKAIIFMIIIFLIELLNSFDDISNIKDYITFVFIMILMYLFIYSNNDCNEKKKIIWYYILGTALSSFVFLLKTFRTVPIMEFINLKYRLGVISKVFDYTDYDLKYNANELALFVVIAIAFLLVWKNKMQINKALYLFFLIYFFTIGVFTMSRAFLIATIIIFVIYIFDNRKKIKQTVITASLIGIAFIFIINFTNLFSGGIIKNFKSRFEVDDLTGGRSEIIKTYNKIIFSSLRKTLLGSGMQEYSVKNNYKYSSHNTTQEIIVCWGIIGGIAFCFLVYHFYRTSKIEGFKYNLTVYLPFIALLFMIQTIPFVSQGTIIFMFYIVLAPFGIEIEDEKILTTDEILKRENI